eukprot:319010-Chlamydomonas_euryale.AAC.7
MAETWEWPVEEGDEAQSMRRSVTVPDLCCEQRVHGTDTGIRGHENAEAFIEREPSLSIGWGDGGGGGGSGSHARGGVAGDARRPGGRAREQERPRQQTFLTAADQLESVQEREGCVSWSALGRGREVLGSSFSNSRLAESYADS